MIAHLRSHPNSLVLIKSGAVAEVVHDLPASLCLRTAKRRGAITVGRVVHRDEERPVQLAGRP